MGEADVRLWIGRFELYTPIALVDFVRNASNTDPITRLALDELDRRLLAAGCQPREVAGRS